MVCLARCKDPIPTGSRNVWLNLYGTFPFPTFPTLPLISAQSCSARQNGQCCICALMHISESVPFLPPSPANLSDHKYWIASRHSCKSTTFVYRRDKWALLHLVVVNSAGQLKWLKRCLFPYAWEETGGILKGTVVECVRWEVQSWETLSGGGALSLFLPHFW